MGFPKVSYTTRKILFRDVSRWIRPPQGPESRGAVRERSERTSAERPEARERRCRRKQGPEAVPDRECRAAYRRP